MWQNTCPTEKAFIVGPTMREISDAIDFFIALIFRESKKPTAQPNIYY